MKTLPMSFALVALCAAFAPAVACSSSSGGSSGGGRPDAGVDEGAPDSMAAQDTALPPVEAASPDTGTSPADSGGGGGEAGACGTPRTARGASCDACVQTNCDATWCACAGDPANVDGGSTGCLGYAKCVEQCVADDAGTPTSCFQTVCALATYTSTEEQEGQAFLDCLVQYCAPDCGE